MHSKNNVTLKVTGGGGRSAQFQQQYKNINKDTQINTTSKSPALKILPKQKDWQEKVAYLRVSR